MSASGPVFRAISCGGLARRLAHASVAALGVVLVGCASLTQADLVRKARENPNSLLIVDCELPPRVINQGLAMTYLEAGQAIKTTALDCGIRGGKYVAYDRANYKTALEVWLEEAKKGNAEAETNVGEIYEKGMGLPPDYATAAKWYEKAAAQGYSRAQVNLGYLYETGKGVSKDLSTALNWYRKASGLTGDDLTFVSSIQAETQAQITQAKAEVGALSSELEASQREINSLRQSLEASQAQVAGSQDKLRQTLDSLGKARSELERLKRAPPEQQRQELPQLDREIRDKQVQANAETEILRQHEEQFRRENGELLTKLAKAEQRASALNLQLDRNKFETAQLQARLAQTDAALAQLKLEYQARQQSVSVAPAQNGKVKELEERLAQRESELRSQQGRVGELEQEIVRISQEKSALEKQTGSAASQRDKSLEAVSRQLTMVMNMLRDEKARADRLAQEKANLAEELNRQNAAQGDNKDAALRAMAKQIDDYARQRAVLANELAAARSRPQPLQLASRNIPAARDNPEAVRQPSLPGNLNFGRYFALVIGNDRYIHSDLPSLDTPVNDATAVGRVLRDHYGFEVKELTNATRYDILTALNQFRDKLTEKDNLLIYYAGHGELDKVNQRGEWLPVDAERNNTANWISTNAITDIINTIAARHILVVADSCYSGAMTRAALATIEPGVSEQVKERWLKKMLENKSRTVLTSGGLQPVLDRGSGGHSIFAKAFIDALAQNEGVLPGQALFSKISGKVKQAAERFGFDQTPQYAPIRFTDHEASDFFFVPKKVI